MVVATIVYFIAKKRKEKKVTTPKNVTSSKKVNVDNAPYTKDVSVVLNKGGIIEIKSDMFDYGDVDGDKITSFKLYNSSEPLFLDKDLTIKYQEGDELSIDTVLYAKLDKGEKISVSYVVRSKDKWSL